ncbi:MAG TPA: DUF2127 domain-containing protein [Actinomycetota bacterium]
MFGRKRKHRTHLFGWHPETFVCSRRGHVTPAALVQELRPEDSGLGVDLPDGRRMARCTRCDVWISTTPPAKPVRETLPPLPTMRIPRRGRPLREAIILRVIAIDRALHSFLFGLLAVLLVLVETNLADLKKEASDLIGRVTGGTGQGATQGIIDRELQKLLHLSQGTLTILIATAIAYCVVEGVEAWGLWHEKRWAEYLTAIATAGFLPFEIKEIVDKVTFLRVAALVVNIAILVWLLWRKRLFGINGGMKAAKAEEEAVDREALFGAPQETGAVVTR